MTDRSPRPAPAVVAPPPAPTAELLPGLRPDDDPYRASMLEAFSWPLRLVSELFFRRARPGLGIQGVRDVARQGTVVYVMRTRSTLDWLFFNWLARKHELPLARYANGIDNGLVAPLGATLRSLFARRRVRAATGAPLPDAVDAGYLRRLVAGGASALIFLRRGRDIFARDPERDLIEELVEAQRASAQPIFLVPQILVWERSPDRANRGLMDVLMGDPERPGRIRKVLFFLLNHRHAVPRVGEPLDLQRFVAEHEGQPTARVAKKLRWLLLGYLYRERRVVKGPDVRPRRWIFDRILAEPAVRAVIERNASQQGRPVAAIEKRARKILDRAGADFRFGMVNAFRAVLDFVCSRIYSGVEFDDADAERIRAAARRGTVVLVPSHRSHFDYLLLSWLCFWRGLMPPHIAAGDNLAFFPMGPIFRRSGAFFIRRSFAGDDLYAVLIAAYVKALVAEGYTQEFFIEGGRSRTGKMLAPKVGLLSTYVEAMSERIAPDVLIVPIYIAYERIVEDYTTELAGGEKKKESAGNLVRSASVLRKRFGRVYVKTNDAISLRDELDALDTPWKQLDREHAKDHLKYLARKITADIQDVTVVTPSTVAATVLLCHDRRGITRERFLRRAQFVRQWLEGRRAWFSDAWHFPEDALIEAVELFASNRLVEVVASAGDEGDIYAIDPDPQRRMQLDYYKNNILFHFVPAAYFLLGIALGGGDDERLDRVRRRFRFLRELFAEEFLFRPDAVDDDLLREAGGRLQNFGIVEVVGPSDDDAAALVRGEDPSLPHESYRLAEHRGDDADVHVRVANPARAAVLLATIRNYAEAYYVVLKGAKVLRKGPLTEKALLDALMKIGRAMALTEDITRPEAITQVTLSNAVKHFRARGVFPVYDGTGKDERVRLDEEVRERFLGPLEQLYRATRPGPDRPTVD